jgi:penicillin amidase
MRVRSRDRGSAGIPGLEHPVEVVWDDEGVPHLYGRSLADVMAAQGHVHARERLFQMEVGRRLAAGRLAEVLGPRMLAIDRHLRVIGLGRAARLEADRLTLDQRAPLAAYARGVNAALAERRPLELRLLLVRPEPWQPSDSLLFAKLMALSLGQNFEAELLRARLRDRLGAKRTAAVEPGYEGPTVLAGPPLVAGAGDVLGDAARARTLAGGGPAAGSNSWVVGPDRSATGAPILANDPHLALGLPPVWFVNHLSWPGHDVIGFSLPGSPGVVIGHNGDVAWGFTNAMADTQDLFEERFDAADPLRYATPDGWQTAELVREEIQVRGRRRPVVEEVRVTRHGPVVTPALDAAAGRSYALSFTALEPGAIVSAVLGMMGARDADELEEATRGFAGAVQNMVYADRHGRIGYRMVGGPIPLRPRGIGLVPVDGASGDDDWTGHVPFDEMPAVRDPADGVVVTANNRILEDGAEPFVSAEWMNGYRARRIREQLDELDRVDVEDCCRIQCDLRSLPGLRLQAIAGRYAGATPLEREALRLLAEWDGELTAASAGGAVYSVLLAELTREAHADLEDDLATLLGRGICELFSSLAFLGRTTPSLLARLEVRDDGWLPGDDTWDEVFARALATAARTLAASLGGDPNGWTWGGLHTLVLDHPLAELPPLRRMFRRGPYPIGGDTDTVWQTWYAPWLGWGGAIGGPSMRMVVDLADPDRSRFILPGGQSGDPRSGAFHDQIAEYLSGQTRQLRFTRAAVERGTRRVETIDSP